MSPTPKWLLSSTPGAVVLAACLALAACGWIPKIPATGVLHGQRIDTTVDSEIARYYLEDHLQGSGGNGDLRRRIESLDRQFDGAIPTRDQLRDISREFSVDFAALFLAHRLLVNECNRALNLSFARLVGTKEHLAAGIASSYLVLFVPGWDYAANGHVTGADFARPRAIASRLGLENHLVELPPIGSVEQSANVLAAEIARRSRTGKKIILAGASSAGPAIHLVLAERLSSSERAAIKAWLNLGGILQGSPLIDHADAKPWLLDLIAWYMGWDKEAIRSMAAGPSRSRFARLNIGPGILVVNYLGVPMSGQLSRLSRDKYPILRPEGPNDGLTMLADVIAPGSLTIVALGSDHFFAEDPAIDDKTVALVKVMLAYLEDAPPRNLDSCHRARPGRG